MNPFQKIEPLLAHIHRLNPKSTELYLVGGAVRDGLLNREIVDLDFAVRGKAIAAARKIADALGGDFYALDKERDTGRVILSRSDGPTLILDFAALRGPDLATDLARRDFTINAIAIALDRPTALIDPLQGIHDLQAKIIRLCYAAGFKDDPIRIIRCVRLAILLGFKIELDTIQRLRMSTPQLQDVSTERVRDELFKILDGPNAAAGLRMLDVLGAIEALFPELSRMKLMPGPPPAFPDQWETSLAAVSKLALLLQILGPLHDPEEGASWTTGLASVRLGRFRQQISDHLQHSPNPNRSMKSLLSFAALFGRSGQRSTGSDDVDTNGSEGQNVTRTSSGLVQRGQALHLSGAEIERLDIILRHIDLPQFLAQNQSLPSRRQVYRFFRSTAAAGVDICLLSLANLLADYGAELPQDMWVRLLDVVRALLEAWWEHRDEQIAPPALLNGIDLMDQFSLKPGPQIGKILEGVREAQAAGEIGTRREAILLARQILDGVV